MTDKQLKESTQKDPMFNKMIERMEHQVNDLGRIQEKLLALNDRVSGEEFSPKDPAGEPGEPTAGDDFRLPPHSLLGMQERIINQVKVKHEFIVDLIDHLENYV